MFVKQHFRGKAFVPQQAVALPAHSEAVVIVAQDDPAALAQLDASLRAYYAALPGGGDARTTRGAARLRRNRTALGTRIDR